jgi:hypothetical protein
MEYIKGSARMLVDSGLLFEINRKILNQFGLTLVVDQDLKAKKQLAIVGLYSTEDPEGFTIDEDAFELGKERFDKFMKKNQSKLDARQEGLGFLVQEKGM